MIKLYSIQPNCTNNTVLQKCASPQNFEPKAQPQTPGYGPKIIKSDSPIKTRFYELKMVFRTHPTFMSLAQTDRKFCRAKARYNVN